MINSIQQISENGSKNLLAAKENFAKTRDITMFEQESMSAVMEFLTAWTASVLEEFDEEIRGNSKRKESWEIVRKDTKQLITKAGTVYYDKTLYKNKQSGEYTYLLDRALGFEEHQRMTELVEADLLKEAAESSYRKGGESGSLGAVISKTGVMEKIHRLDFSKVPIVKPKNKKVVPYLYIDADEDHVALQFNEKKGDLVERNGRKSNCVFAKLIYVYEGVEPEAPKSQRNRLIAPHYFSGTYSGKENRKLWQEVYDYLDATYDLSKVKRIYLNSDAGAWINGARDVFGRLTRVLDEFHINEYLLRITGGLLDSAGDARAELVNAIKTGKQEDFGYIVQRIIDLTEGNAGRKRIADSANYILGNWRGAKTRLVHREGVVGCSAEGHVSHVLSDRMSSRPLGWSRTGADKIAHLRAYYYNAGDMLTLVRSQKLQKAVGAENVYLSPGRISAKAGKWNGKYVDAVQATVSIAGQKAAWCAAGISFI